MTPETTVSASLPPATELGRRAASLVFLAFAFAYFLSALIRAITATLAPTLTQEFALQARIGGNALGRGRVLGRRQHAKRELGDERAALVHSADVVVRAHADRQFLSFNRLRRSQVRIVLSGTLWRSASCS